ncbi:receptor-like protein 7 [Humulus lupulus]|uniref:receptor-like protein 7 n=1 Tax=Humulus lupulus TaxID=3486 RepID=UPI002B41224F|nr:receptor-like protein 7 [Humulus lupulus]
MMADWPSLMWFVYLLLFYSQTNPSSSLSSLHFPLCHLDESIALLQFKNSFSVSLSDPDDDCYDKTTSWENGTNCCTWNGVTCDKLTGHVINLNVHCSGLQGILLPNNSLFSLSHLRTLILSGNGFFGSQISSEFGKFTYLTRLNISNSGFSGYVPLEIAHLSKLTSLDISSSDDVKLDTSTLKRIVQNLTHLRELHMANNDLSSVVLPASFVNLSSSLISLDLSDTKLQGEFPTNIFRLPNLLKLYLWGNDNLTGSFPKSNWSSHLMELDLSSSGFSIDIAYLTRNLKNLNSLFLSVCKFVGSYPKLVGNFTQIIQLDLSFNNFSGQVPWSSLNFSRIISLDLSVNNFIGKLPQTVKPPPLDLKILFLFENNFNGTLPCWLSLAPSLQHVDLHGNQFTGVINEFQTHSLEGLDLHDNKLQGMIPRSVSLQSNLFWLDLSSNNLAGVVEFDLFAKLQILHHLNLSFNNFSSASSNSINYTLPMLSELSLSSCNITQFPLFLKALTNLMVVDLSNNQIQGKVPKWLGNMGTDSLNFVDLSHNFLTNIEQIPWKNLNYLFIHSNYIQGTLPTLPPSIAVFSISNNQLSAKLPSSFCKLDNIQILDLSHNNLSGKLPPCIGNISATVLDFRHNRFHGVIPSTFANGNKLINLNLNGNELEGSLPQSLINCKMLEILDVGNNKINGTFPNWLDSLPMLQVLILRSNRFYGPISDSKAMAPFQKLRILDISNNEFSGLLPRKYFENMVEMMNSHTDTLKYIGDEHSNSAYYHDSVKVVLKGFFVELVRIQTIFTTIDFSKNDFEGKIPNSIEKLKSLKGLNFSHNKLTGSIPASLGNLTNLEWLDLSLNQLVGVIPKQLEDLTYLEVLNLSRNQLVGPIPTGNQFNTFQNDSYLGNQELCGFPLSKACENKSIDVSFEQESNDSSPAIFDWKFALIGYGCGLVFGISMGYVVISNEIVDQLVGKYVGRGQRCKSRKRPKRNTLP